jgi:hypothetical protein
MKNGKRGSRKMGGRKAKKGSRKTNRKKSGGMFGSIGTAFTSLASRGVKPPMPVQPQYLPWTGTFSANRLEPKLMSKIFIYEMDYNGPANTLIIKFDKVGVAQLQMKSGIKKILEKIGMTLPEDEGYFAIGKGGATGNQYWSKTNIVTFNFSGRGIVSINISSDKQGQPVNKTIDVNDKAVTNKSLFENGFDIMKGTYDEYLKTGQVVVTEMNPGPVQQQMAVSNSFATLGALAPADPESVNAQY